MGIKLRDIDTIHLDLVLWTAITFNVIGGQQRIEGTYCLHFQGRNEWYMVVWSVKQEGIRIWVSILLTIALPISQTL